MEEIKSLSNQLIKDAKKLYQKKYRDVTRQFLVEGIRMVEEALKRDRLVEVFYDQSLVQRERGRALVHKIEKSAVSVGSGIHQVTPDVIRALTETETPQGIVAVVHKPDNSLTSLAGTLPLMIADGIQDPGNLGTMIRTAWAAGAGGIICLPGTVDPYNSKTVRSTMGGIFSLNILTNVPWEELLVWLRQREYLLVAGVPGAVENYYDINYKNKTAVIIGSESKGLCGVNSNDLDVKVNIPLMNEAESLNAAVASGILLYEILRQRIKSG